MDEIIWRDNKFWLEYLNSDEIKQIKLLEKLPLFQKKDKDGFLRFISITLIKSYIDDAIQSTKIELIDKVIRWHLSQDGYYDECSRKKGYACDFCEFIEKLEGD